MKISISIIWVLVILIMGCDTSTKNESSLQSSIIGEVFYPSLDSVLSDYRVDGKILVLNQDNSDKARQIVIEQIIESNPDLREDVRHLLTSLVDKLYVSLELSINEKIKQPYSFFYKEESIRSHVDFDSEEYFGSVGISGLAVYGKSGCFYMTIFCGNQCSKGYLIFVRKLKTRWELENITNVWSG